MTTHSRSPPALRCEALRDALLGTADLLKRRRAGDIADGYGDDYVALNWLEWNGGLLRFTATGDNVCKHLVACLG